MTLELLLHFCVVVAGFLEFALLIQAFDDAERGVIGKGEARILFGDSSIVGDRQAVIALVLSSRCSNAQA